MNALNALGRGLMTTFVVISSLCVLAFSLLLLEASGGHDGWLCEWGYDTDGAGTTTSGCG